MKSLDKSNILITGLVRNCEKSLTQDLEIISEAFSIANNFDVLIIGGGVAGMQCALVIGSGLKKPFAIDKKVGIIMHQRSSHLQNALFNNVLGLPSGTLGSNVLIAGKKQLTTNYPNITQIEQEKVISITIQNNSKNY